MPEQELAVAIPHGQLQAWMQPLIDWGYKGPEMEAICNYQRGDRHLATKWKFVSSLVQFSLCC